MRVKAARLSHWVPVVAALFVFSACDGLEGKLKLIEGNFLFSRGKYNEAIAAYLEAGDDPKLASYIDFALGSTYLVLERPDAALERFSQAEEKLEALKDSAALLYRIRYNSGVIRFDLGDFTGAAADFRRAIEADSSQPDAKRNFELSLVSQYMKNQSAAVQKISTGQIAEEENKARSEIIFDFIRQKEVDRWKTWEWTAEADEGTPDY
jgi:Ca-activated chloride channel family protein